MKSDEGKRKFRGEFVASQILRALVKSIPVAGPGLEEIFFGSAEKVDARKRDESLRFILEHLSAEIEGISAAILTEEELDFRVRSLLRSKDDIRETLLGEVSKHIPDTDRPISDSISRYLRDIARETIGTIPADFDIFAIPIKLDPGNLQFEDVRTILRIRERRIVLHGKPASGKTTAVNRVLATAREQASLIPIRLGARDVSDLRSVQDATCAKLGLPSTAVYTRLEMDGRLLYLLDGLNEYPDVETLARDIYDLSDSLMHSRFLVTCRSHEYRAQAKAHLKGFKRFVIKDLSWDDQKNFILHKVKPKSKRERLLSAFRHQPLLRKACSNQFIFLMAVLVVPDQKIELRVTSDFYASFLRRFLGDWEKYADVERRKELLEEIAHAMSSSGETRVSIGEEQAENVAGAIDMDEGPQLLREMFRSGLLEKHEGGVKFFQQTFQEFLLASWMIRSGVFPKHLERKENGRLEHKQEKWEMTELSERFYLELSGILTLRGKELRKRPNVFLCHTAQDKRAAREVAVELRNAGLGVWLDEWQLEPGDSLIRRMTSAIEECDYLAAFLSSRSVESEWVQKDLEIAATKDIKGQGILVIPIVLDDCGLPSALAAKYHVDLRCEERRVAELGRLLHTIGARFWKQASKMTYYDAVNVAEHLSHWRLPTMTEAGRLGPEMIRAGVEAEAIWSSTWKDHETLYVFDLDKREPVECTAVHHFAELDCVLVPSE